jgi:hypothetical protein
MAVLKNSKWERFAQFLTKGMTQLAAYEAAGYKPDEGHAARLAANGKVVARRAELQAMTAKRVVKTATDIVMQLAEDRKLAHSAKQAGAAVSASMGQAKVLGFITDKHAVGMKRLEDMTEDELAALLGESDASSRDRK